MDGKLQPSLSISDHATTTVTGSTITMADDKENPETLNVEVEREEAKNERKSSSASSNKQLYVQVKRKRVKRQYRRNQDAINFLRRFTLAVVIIDLILSISESSLISTFFLFVTLSTTFDVKPENVIDTYCYYYQRGGGGNSMCEQYMERVTGYSTPSSTMNHHHRSSSSSSTSSSSGSSSSSSPSENHFPTVPSRPPLTPSESRKLFLAYNQSLVDYPARFGLVEKIDKDSKLSRLYSRLIYLLFEQKKGILNESRSLDEFLLKNENGLSNSNDQETFTADNFTTTTPENSLLHSSISKRLKQSIQVVPPQASSSSPSTSKADHLLFFLCSKTLEKLRAAKKINQKRTKDADNNNNKPSFNTETSEPSLGSPIRKTLIQATDFVRHRWKRDAYMVTSTTGNYEMEHVKNVQAWKMPTGSSSSSTTAPDYDADSGQQPQQQQGKEKLKGSSSLVSAPSTQQTRRVSGYRLIKGHNNGYTKKESVTKATISRRDVSPVAPAVAHPFEISSFINQSREYCKNDIQMMIFTMSKQDLHELLKNQSPQVNINKSDGKQKRNGNNNKNNKNVDGEMKYLEDLFVEPAKTPRHILSLMEISLFNNWQQFSKTSKRLSLHYFTDDNGTPKDDKDEYLIWSSIREEIMEKFMLNMETDIFSQETYRKAERRKRAVEQMYHDYSFTILEELKNVKDMQVSRTFYGIYWVIKIYVVTWQTSICMVLFFGSVFEDKTALNIWGIFNILTSLLHFMVDDWINTTFQPEKTSASIWFGVIYGVYKPITILLVATLSSEIFKNDGADKKGVIARVREIIRGRKRPSLIGEKCLGKLKGLFITSASLIENEGNAAAGSGGGGGDGVDKKCTAASTSKGKNNGNVVYKGIKAVKIRAKIKRMEMNNGNLIVITQTVTSSSGMKNAERFGLVCRKCRDAGYGNDDEEKMHEGYLVYPSSVQDNEAGLITEDIYPEETEDDEEDEEEDEDELEEVVDEDDDDESDEEDDADNEECSHPDHDHHIMRESQRPCATAAAAAAAGASNDEDASVMTGEKMPADITTLSETRMSGGGVGGTKNNGQSGLSLIAYAGNGIQGNLLHDSNTRAPTNGQGDDLLHGPIVDGGNLHI